MNIIIIGCGRLGSTLALELADAGYNIAVIDSEAKKLEALGSGFNGLAIRGIEYDNNILKQAGISRASFVILVTPDDNLNITAALIAKNIFKVPRVIAKINNPSKKDVFKVLDIETINPTELISYMIKSKIEGEPK